MTDLMSIDMEGEADLPGSRLPRQRPKRIWQWQRRTGAGAGFRLQRRVDCTAGESEAAFRVREHLDYLRKMAAEGVVPKSLATKARAVWWVAQVSTGAALPVPAAAAFAGGPVEYHWSAAPHQLSAEIPADGPCHWTYRNGTTGELWGVETAVDEGLPSKLIRVLTRVAANSH